MIDKIRVFHSVDDYFGSKMWVESIIDNPYEEQAMKAVAKFGRRRGFDEYFHVDHDGVHDVFFWVGGQLRTIHSWGSVGSRDAERNATMQELRDIVRNGYKGE